MQKYFKYGFIIIGLFFIKKLNAQDIHFSQFQTAPLWQNPAFTGEFGGSWRLTALHRNQWPSSLGNYKTSLFSFDSKIQVPNSFSHFGIGMLFYTDKAGDLNLRTTTAQLSVAYNMYVGSSGKSDFYLYAGARYGRTNQRFDDSQIEGADPFVGFNTETEYFDFTSGVAFAWILPSFFLHTGVSIAHLNNPDISFEQRRTSLPGQDSPNLPQTTTIHLAGNFSLLNNKISFIPAIQYQKQGTFTTIIAGADLKFNDLKQKFSNTPFDWSFGIHHRMKDALIMSTKFRFKQQYNIGLSYDLPISKITAPTSAFGAVEVFISLTLPQKRKQGDFPRQGGGLINLKCPSADARPNERNLWFRDNGVGF